MPYICMTRSDIADGTLQVLDLIPNSSLRVPPVDLPGQTRYINRVKVETVSVVGGKAYGSRSSENATGLGAYVADCFDKTGAVLSTAEIAIAVEEILALLDGAASAMSQANVEGAVVAGTASGTPIAGFQASANFVLENLLKVLAGASYIISKGTTLAVGTNQGAFTLDGLNIAKADSVTKTEEGLSAYITANFTVGGVAPTADQLSWAREEIIYLVEKSSGNKEGIVEADILSAVQTGLVSGNPLATFASKGNPFSNEDLLTAYGHRGLEKSIANASSSLLDFYHINGELYEWSQAVTLYSTQTASDSATGYPARQHPIVKRSDALIPASGRVIVVYNDDGSILV